MAERGILIRRWVVVVGLAVIAHVGLLRPRLFRWGATDEEAQRAFPGDDEVPGAQVHGTRAITIDAPPEAVWPWIAQIGYRRAGWYAFDFADNDDIPSATRIIPELQDPQVGQVIGEEGYTIVAIEPPRLLLLAFHHPRVEWIVKGGVWPRFGASSWAFILEPTDGGHRTRLITRLHYRLSGFQWLLWPPFEIVDLVLQPVMLRAIKRRVDATLAEVATPLSEPAAVSTSQ
jgi:uncharacterized protein YndB with AHSA1/START domain